MAPLAMRFTNPPEEFGLSMLMLQTCWFCKASCPREKWFHQSTEMCSVKLEAGIFLWAIWVICANKPTVSSESLIFIDLVSWSSLPSGFQWSLANGKHWQKIQGMGGERTKVFIYQIPCLLGHGLTVSEFCPQQRPQLPSGEPRM